MASRLTLILIALCGALVVGCVSSAPTLQMGLQPKYEAVNPSRILAVPPLSIPDPTRGNAKIDQSAVESGQLITHVEDAVIGAFKGQPAVNGVPFATVRRELGKPPALLNDLERDMALTAKRLTSREPQDLSSFSKQCIARKNFIEFYSFCVAPTKEWKDHLNALSAKIYNADSALFVVITEAQKKVTDGRYESTLGLAILLVDTNNASLIWGRSKEDAVKSLETEKAFPEWKTIVPAMLDSNFWEGFPGRRLTK